MFISHKKLKIGYFDAHPALVSAEKIHLENQFQALSDYELTELKSLAQIDPTQLDLLVVRIGLVDEKETLKWLKGFVSKMSASDSVWVPALVLASGFELNDIKELFEYAYPQNYYFDIFSGERFEDLAIRGANLVRLHEHMMELERYQKEVAELQKRVEDIESKLDKK